MNFKRYIDIAVKQSISFILNCSSQFLSQQTTVMLCALTFFSMSSGTCNIISTTTDRLEKIFATIEFIRANVGKVTKLLRYLLDYASILQQKLKL